LLEENQIWDLYDEYDGIYHYYYLIIKFVSFNPFNMQMIWLDKKDHHGEKLIKWEKFEFWRACGEFKVGWKIIFSSHYILN